jgi:hypothetical protein
MDTGSAIFSADPRDVGRVATFAYLQPDIVGDFCSLKQGFTLRKHRARRMVAVQMLRLAIITATRSADTEEKSRIWRSMTTAANEVTWLTEPSTVVEVNFVNNKPSFIGGIDMICVICVVTEALVDRQS